jgi:hypothetical protein
VRGERFGVLVGGDLLEAELSTGRRADLRRGVGERQQVRTGHLVGAALVPRRCQRGRHDVGDVVGVDERLGDITDRKREDAGQNGGRPERAAARTGDAAAGQPLDDPSPGLAGRTGDQDRSGGVDEGEGWALEVEAHGHSTAVNRWTLHG